LQFALDRAGGVAELRGDLLDAVALQAGSRHRLQLGVAEPPEQAATLVGDLGGEGRRRLAAEQGVERLGVGRGAAAALLPRLVAHQVGGLARGEDDEQVPEAVAVGQAREAALFGAAAEAVEDAQGDVFLVGGAARRGASCAPARPGA
jgi:hypothetical protein